MNLDKAGTGSVSMNLNEEIQKLKDGGNSLRKIAETLHPGSDCDRIGNQIKERFDSYLKRNRVF
jgi:hypothetical protein